MCTNLCTNAYFCACAYFRTTKVSSSFSTSTNVSACNSTASYVNTVFANTGMCACFCIWPIDVDVAYFLR